MKATVYLVKNGRKLALVYHPQGKEPRVGNRSRSVKAILNNSDISKQIKWKKYSYDINFHSYQKLTGCEKSYSEFSEDYQLCYSENFKWESKHKRKTKDILFVSHEMTLTGAPIVLLSAVETAVKAGHFCVVMCPQDGPLREKIMEIGALVIINPSAKNNQLIFRLFAGCFDFVVVNSIACYWAINALNDESTPVFWWIHEGTTALEAYRPVLPQYIGQNVFEYFVSKYSLDICAETLTNGNKQRILTYPVDVTQNADTPCPLNKNNKTVFLLCGSIESRKGQDIFLEAIHILGKEYQEKAEFIFIGAALDENILAAIMKNAKEMPCIRYYPTMSHDEVLQHFRRINCLVAPSRDDPFPVTCMESMMMSKPVIVSDKTGTSYLITDGKDGYVIPAGDASALAEKMKYVIDHREEAKQVGKNGYSIYEKNCNPAAFNTVFFTLIDTFTSPIYQYKIASKILINVEKKMMRRILDLIKRAFASLHKNGFLFTDYIVFRLIKTHIAPTNLMVIREMNMLNKAELTQQRETKFEKNIMFSILVPLYNTPKEYLRDMIESVQEQTYTNWELCLADGSNSDHGYVGKICLKYAKNDQRIKYRKLEKNLGISENTNACVEMAKGDYFGLLDHDDRLHPSALFEVMRVICNKGADFIYTDENKFHTTPRKGYCPHFKPDYAPDTLRANNYICHFSVFSKSLSEKVGLFRSECDGSQDYDMVLRLTEQARCIVHIPKILYHWREHPNSVASNIGAKSYAIEAAHRALRDHMARKCLSGEVTETKIPSVYRIRYEIKGQPLISVIIANKDHYDDLKKCINSIKEKSTYPNWEIIIVENGSEEPETFAYYDELKKDRRIRIVIWSNGWNYSGINNFGVTFAKGDYYLLLNNDTEVITPEWMEEMLMFAQRDDVGAVGTLLYHPDNTVQHAGVILGPGGVASHAFCNGRRGENGYFGRVSYAQNLSAVTGACMMVPKRVWEQVDGLDESFAVAFNDVDLCMRIRKAGYLIVWTPFAELYHYESKSRGSDEKPEKRERFLSEIQRFQELWGKELDKGDPYYNPHFSLEYSDFRFALPKETKERIRKREALEKE